LLRWPWCPRSLRSSKSLRHCRVYNSSSPNITIVSSVSTLLEQISTDYCLVTMFITRAVRGGLGRTVDPCKRKNGDNPRVLEVDVALNFLSHCTTINLCGVCLWILGYLWGVEKPWIADIGIVMR
jgi:hypothetical protein